MPSFHPPSRPSPRTPGAYGEKSTEGGGWVEAVTEKDDLLLYITAAMGVLMPALIYFVYHKIHAAYMRYAKRKEEERLAEEKAKAELAIFYTRGNQAPLVVGQADPQTADMGVAEMRAKQLEGYMGEEHPRMVVIEDLDPAEFAKFKGFGVFIIECSPSGHPQQSYEWFLDWLENAAADKKERKKMATGDLRYAVLGVSAEGKCMTNKAAETLSKRLRILGASAVVPDRNFDKECVDYDPEETFQIWTETLFYGIDRWGMEDEDEMEYEDEDTEESGADEEEMEAVEDPTEDGVRRRKV